MRDGKRWRPGVKTRARSHARTRLVEFETNRQLSGVKCAQGRTHVRQKYCCTPGQYGRTAVFNWFSLASLQKIPSAAHVPLPIKDISAIIRCCLQVSLIVYKRKEHYEQRNLDWTRFHEERHCLIGNMHFFHGSRWCHVTCQNQKCPLKATCPPS